MVSYRGIVNLIALLLRQGGALGLVFRTTSPC